jgi:hypothetical protein
VVSDNYIYVRIHEIFQLFKRTQVTLHSYQLTGKSLPTHTLQDDLNDFLVLVPTDKVHEISLDYLANDPEVQEAVAYLQSEEFHMLHTTVEDLKEFKDVSTFICIFLKPQSDRKECLISLNWRPNCSLLVYEIHE